MLRFLVTSMVRRRLLELLWAEQAHGTAAELARAADVGFASAYRELKSMRRFGLVTTTHENGRENYAANLEHPDADILRRLTVHRPRLQAPKGEADRLLRRKLRTLGAPLTVEPADQAPDLERSLVEGVKLSRRDPTVARALTLCFWRQRHRLRQDKLASVVKELGEKHGVGFLLELTGVVAADPRFARWAKPFRDRRVRATQDFFEVPPAEGSRELAEAHTPAVARKWGFRMNMDLASFQTLFDKFAPFDA